MRSVIVSLARCVPIVAFLCLAGAGARAQVVTGPSIQVPRGSGVRPHSARVFVVDATPGSCAFSTTIQGAVDAALDGDVIVVKKGVYPAFVIDGKAVHIFGQAGPGGTDVQVDHAVVRHTRVGRPLVLHGLQFKSASAVVPLSFINDSGPMWVQHCQAAALGVQDCASVGIHDTDVTLRGVEVSGSTVYAYRSSFAGSAGSSGGYTGICNDYYYYLCTYCNSCYSGSPGGVATTISARSHAYFFGGTLQGGRGAPGVYVDCCYAPPAPDGAGLLVNALSDATVMDAQITGGTSGAGSFATLGGKVGGYSISAPVVSGTQALLTFRGPVGWNVFLTYSFDFQPQFVSERSGYSVVDPASPTMFIGALPSSGRLQVSLPLNLAPGEDATMFYSQAKLYDPATGTPYLAEPAATVVVRSACL